MSNKKTVTENQLKASIIPIKIIMNTNIPDNHKIDFDSGYLYHPELKNTSNLNKFPFFTNLYRYNEGVILNKPYNKIVNFFFNKNTFIEKLTKSGSEYGSPENLNEPDENNLHNIMVMLKALFHINEKIIEQEINNSYENKYGSIEETSDFGENAKNLLNSIFNTNNVKKIITMDIKDNYTYLILNGEKYTFQRVVWLNDLKNNPFYKELIKEYIIFNRWLNSKKGSKYKKLLDENSFETIENNYKEDNTYRKSVAYWKEAKKEKEKGSNINLMIKLYNEKEFKKFYEILQKYQNKETKNEKLQDTIENSLSDTGSMNIKSKINIIDILRKLMNNDKTKNITNEYYYIDILHDTKNDNYEINILADFLKGEMNDEKYKKLKCVYESNKLGNFLEEQVFSKKKSIENKNKNTIYSIDDNKTIDVKYKDDENEDEIGDNVDESKSYEELLADKLGDFIDKNDNRKLLKQKYKDDNIEILKHIKKEVPDLYVLINLWYENVDNKYENKKIRELIEKKEMISKIMSSENVIFYSSLFNSLKEFESKKTEKKGGKKRTNKIKKIKRRKSRKTKKTKKNI
jgi:hypothetical protein